MILCPLKARVSDLPVWIEATQTWSYRELDELVDLWVTHLIQYQVGPLFRIALFSYPNISLVALLFAAWRLGASVCLINPRLPPALIQKTLARLEPQLYWEHPPLLQKGIVKTKIDTLDSSTASLYLMTSGSTAEPKIAVLSLHNLLANAASTLNFFDLKPGDKWLLNLPLFHVSGMGILLRSILAHATVVTSPLDPDITHISAVPTHLYRASPVYKKLKWILLGGAPLAPIPSSLPLIATYGLTEMGSAVLAKKNPMNEFLGFPLPGREMKIAEDGEIWVRGESLFQGYFQNGQLIKQEGWFPTKDLGRFDPKEGFAILGRKDWQFISGGENIQPEEIEKILFTLFGFDAAVLPIQDPEFGARPVAFVTGSLSLHQMKTELSKHLPKYKIPVHLFSLEEIPKRGLKIDREVLFNILEKKIFNSQS